MILERIVYMSNSSDSNNGTQQTEKNQPSMWTALYEFLDDFFGALIPGIFFCLYILLGPILALNISIKNDNLISGLWVPFFGVSYVLGNIFRRRDMRKLDKKSCNYILKKHLKSYDSNALAFIQILPSKDITSLFESMKYRNDFKKHVKLEMSIFNFLTKHDHYKLSLIFLSKICKKMKKYKYLKSFSSSADSPPSSNSNNKFDLLNDHDLILTMNYYCMSNIEYPYNNLKQYLQDRNVICNPNNNIPWSGDEVNTTPRSKSFVNGIKNDLGIKHPNQVHILYKEEAQIRFMNSLWYAASLIFKITIFWLIIFLLVILCYFCKYPTEPNSIISTIPFYSHFDPWLKSLYDLFKKLSIFANLSRLKETFSFLVLINVVFFMLSFYIKHSIKTNFHYQRIKEIVTILQIDKCLNSTP